MPPAEVFDPLQVSRHGHDGRREVGGFAVAGILLLSELLQFRRRDKGPLRQTFPALGSLVRFPHAILVRGEQDGCCLLKGR